ncbi:hypothetical protein LCGC14_2925600 [marine sediment metagenome]|uniref:Uncharacterized protein n=1 Tax=marine sediment metagenome TaxID=412755 RepID=A0A0F8ZV79_9ZZZZ
MDDLDRLFALVDLVSNAETVKKNTADLRLIRKEKAAHKKAFKDAKYAIVESERQLALIISQRDALKASKEDLAKREARLNDRERAVALSVREANKAEKAGKAELETRETAVASREARVAKHEKSLALKKAALTEREVDIRKRGANLASAVSRAVG